MWNHNEKLNYNRLKMLKGKLNEIYDSKTKLIQARSKANWIKKNHRIFHRPGKPTSMSKCNK